MRIAQILRDGSDNLFAPTLECERTVTERFVGREFDGQQIVNEGDNQLEMIVALQPFECADTGANGNRVVCSISDLRPCFVFSHQSSHQVNVDALSLRWTLGLSGSMLRTFHAARPRRSSVARAPLARIREYFIYDFSCWKTDHDAYTQVFDAEERLPDKR